MMILVQKNRVALEARRRRSTRAPPSSDSMTERDDSLVSQAIGQAGPVQCSTVESAEKRRRDVVFSRYPSSKRCLVVFAGEEFSRGECGKEKVTWLHFI